jgi:hypothetical protein
LRWRKTAARYSQIGDVCMAAGVFISFRPEDSAWAARIRDRLQGSVGRDDLGRGADFAKALKTGAAEIEALVLIIGRSWLAGMLDDPSDPVRVEIEAALSRKINVMPVLVDGASIPAAGALPESLKVLAHLRTIELSSGRFDSEMERLEETLHDRPINFSGGPSIELPFPDLSDLGLTGLKGIAAPFEEGTASRRADRGTSARKGAKASARKRVAKTAAPKRAPKKAPKKTAAKKTKVKKAATKKPAAKKVARSRPADRDVASGQPRVGVNQDLSVDAMNDFVSARRAEAPLHKDHPIAWALATGDRCRTLRRGPDLMAPPGPRGPQQRQQQERRTRHRLAESLKLRPKSPRLLHPPAPSRRLSNAPSSVPPRHRPARRSSSRCSCIWRTRPNARVSSRPPWTHRRN